jgi:DNA repair photolyase
LRAKSYKPAPIAVGTNTDPYQPIEREYKVMRECLEVLQRFNHPLTIVTKGTLIERDIDILADMAKRNLVHVGVSVTTLDSDVARKMEPRVPQPARRLLVIKRLSEAGIPVRAMAAPLVPGLTDHEGEAILKAGQEAGAVVASWVMLLLPREVADLWRDWLAEHYPDRFNRVMEKVRAMHGGADYSPEWGKRMRGEGVYAEFVAQRMKIAMRRLGLDQKLEPLRTDLFAVPLAKGDQMSLF